MQLGNKFGNVENFFNATHPFLFFVEEQTTGSIIFVGKLENPLETQPFPLPPRFKDSESTQPLRK